MLAHVLRYLATMNIVPTRLAGYRRLYLETNFSYTHSRLMEWSIFCRRYSGSFPSTVRHQRFREHASEPEVIHAVEEVMGLPISTDGDITSAHGLIPQIIPQ